MVPSFTSLNCHWKTLLVVGHRLLMWLFFPNWDDKQRWNAPWNEIAAETESLSRWNCAIIQELSITIHHVFVCRKQITWILIEILFYLHLNYLCGCLLDSYLREIHEHIMWCKNVCVCICEHFSYIIQSVESEYGLIHMKYIKGPVFDTIYLRSTGQSRAVHRPTIANEIGG